MGTVAVRGRTPFFRGFIEKPRRTLLRKAMFQVHLWLGILLSLYVAVIGFTGAVTVFRMDLAERVPAALQQRPLETAKYLPVDTLWAAAKAAVPGGKAATMFAPDEDKHAAAVVVKQRGDTKIVVIDPYTAQVVRIFSMQHHWAFVIGEIHENLLMGRAGELIAGWASWALLLTLASGLVLWWPGLLRWTKALLVSFRGKWRQVNFDLHNAVGFWTLLFTAMWCVTTLQMVWPEATRSAISKVSPVTAATTEPKVVLPKHPEGCRRANLQSIVDTAVASQPSTRFALLSQFPGPNEPIRLFMARRAIRDRGTWDEQMFDPCGGKQLAVWKRWQGGSAGDWFVSMSRPLHVGFLWGRWAQWLWFLFGMAFPVLSITGLLMYWNRYLRHRWAALRAR